jgi:hypothetical protein
MVQGPDSDIVVMVVWPDKTFTVLRPDVEHRSVRAILAREGIDITKTLDVYIGTWMALREV